MTLRETHPFTHDVKRLFLLMNQRIDDALKPHDLGRAQWMVLANIGKAGELGQKDLQVLMRVEPATLTGIVDVLVAKGWLHRFENPADKRMKVLRFTAEGRKRWRTIPDPVAIAEERMFASLPAEDVGAMRKTMELMIVNLEAEAQ